MDDIPYQISDFSEFFRHILIDGILFFSWLSLGTVLVIIFHKLIIEWRTKRFNAFKDHYRDEITELLFNPQTKHLTRANQHLEFQAASDVIIELMETFDDSVYLNTLHRYLEDYSVHHYYLSLASKKNPMQQLNALERLAAFRYEENRPFFLAIISNPKNSNDLKIAALIGLSYLFHCEDQEIMLSAMNQIDTSGKFSEFIFFNIIERLLATQQENVIHTIFDWLLMHQECLSLKAFIEAISDTNYTPIASKLHDLYSNTPRNDIKISIIRALGNLSLSTEGCDIFLDALKSTNTILRIVASKSISICDSESATAAASHALYDESYQVRHNIARSLLRLPNGIHMLNKTAFHTHDRYAKQIALYALRLRETSHA